MSARKHGVCIVLKEKWICRALGVLACTLAAAMAIYAVSGRNPKALSGRIVLLAGDSRSSADYVFYQEILEQEGGCAVLVRGGSGKDAAYNASDAYFDQIREPHDFSLWLVGGNDSGEAGTVGTFSETSVLGVQGEPVVRETDIDMDYEGETFIQAIDHIMRKYEALFRDERQRANAGKYRMIFCTDLPQQREDANSPWSRQENWERKRNAIIECCEKNQVECLDLYLLCAFDMSQEPMFIPPTDTGSNRGIFFMDGLHPNPEGIRRIVGFEIEKMTEILQESAANRMMQTQ